jgi:putative transposase
VAGCESASSVRSRSGWGSACPAGATGSQNCRKLAISEATFFRWQKRFGQPGVCERRALAQLRDKRRKLRGVVVDLSLEKTSLGKSLKRKG